MATEKTLHYPIDYEAYDTEEIIEIIEFLHLIEAMHETFDAAQSEILLKKHTRFQSIINNKSEEKRIDKAFEAQTGISIYRFMKKIKT